MVIPMGVPQQLAQGTSLAAIVPTAMSGTWVHWRRGYVHWRLVLALAGGGIAAGVGASVLALQLEALVLQRGFAVVLVAALVRMVVRPLGVRRPAPAE